jgi:glycosyltransferase 2 family protein
MPAYAKWLLKVAFSIAILYVIVAKSNVGETFATLKLIAPISVLIGLALAFLQSGCAAARLCVIVELYKRRLPLRDSFRITLESAFFGQTFVSFLGGDALRIWRIRHCGMPLGQAASTVVLDRLVGIAVNHLFLLVALPWLFAEISNHVIRVTLIALAATGVAGFACILLLGSSYGPTHKLARRLDHSRIGRLISDLTTVGRQFLYPEARLLTAALVSLIIALINSLIFFVLLVGWDVAPLTAFGCALLVPAVLEIAMLPISIAGWGVREGVTIIAFSGFGVPSNIALGASIMFAFITLGVALTGGLLWLVDRREFATLSATEAQAATDAPIGASETADSPANR